MMQNDSGEKSETSPLIVNSNEDADLIVSQNEQEIDVDPDPVGYPPATASGVKKDPDCCDQCCCFGQCDKPVGMMKTQTIMAMAVMGGFLVFLWRIAFMVLSINPPGDVSDYQGSWIVWTSLTLSLDFIELLTYLVSLACVIHGITKKDKCCSITAFSFLWVSVCIFVLDLIFWVVGVTVNNNNEQGFIFTWFQWVDLVVHACVPVYQIGLILLVFWLMK